MVSFPDLAAFGAFSDLWRGLFTGVAGAALAGPGLVFLLRAGAGHDARIARTQCRVVSDRLGIDGAGVVLPGDFRA